MGARYYLGIDQGSTSSKGVLIDGQENAISEFREPVTTNILSQDTFEQDGEELLESILKILEKAKSQVRSLAGELRAIGICFQRSGVIAWNSRSLKPVHPFISFRDFRRQPQIDALSTSDKQRIFELSGMPTTAHYAGPKISYLQERFPDSQILVGSLDSFVLHSLNEDKQIVPHTEDSMAHRSLLYSRKNAYYETELCSLLGVDMSRLLPIQASFSLHAVYQGIPIACSLGDHQSALLSLLGKSRACLSLGTTSSFCIATEAREQIFPGFVNSVLYSNENAIDRKRRFTFLTESIINVGGLSVQRIADEGVLPEQISNFCFVKSRSYESEGKGKIPTAFCSLGNTETPDWLIGLPNVTTAWDGCDGQALVWMLMNNLGSFIARNILELKERKAFDEAIQPIPVVGGMSHIDYLIQYVADVTGLRFSRLSETEAGAKGAALGAMFSVGDRSSPTARPQKVEKEFRPSPGSVATETFQAWTTLFEQLKNGEIPKDSVDPFAQVRK